MADPRYVKQMVTKIINLEAKVLVAVIHEKDGKELGILPLDRIEIYCPKTDKRTVALTDFTTTMVKPGELGLFLDVAEELKVEDEEILQVSAMGIPESLNYIKKKLRNQELAEHEIKAIVRDVTYNRLSDIELSAFMTSVYIHGFNLKETIAMTKSLLEYGKRIKLDKGPVLDKHCIGGINGRVTMIVVPIVASAGYYMPKTSSRSITSAAGTADAMEVLASVNLSIEQIKEITEKVGGVICWGGAVELAPADDKIIKVEHPLSIDPPGQIVASVMAKKASVGAEYAVIDLPVGPDVKVKNTPTAKKLAEKFISTGKELGIKVEAVITDGTEPCGNAFGAALEAKYVLETLEGKIFDNLAQKACELAGVLFELVGECEPGKGFYKAKQILTSGKALKKMQEIIAAQGGNIFSSKEIPYAELSYTINAEEEGEISRINVRKLANIARIAGAPADKKAGVMLHVEEGQKIKEDQPLFTIYAENKQKLEVAKSVAISEAPIELHRIILRRYKGES